METRDFFKALWSKIPSGYVDIRMIPGGAGYAKDIFRPVAHMLNLPDESIAYLHEQNRSHHIYHRVSISHDARDGKKYRNISYVPALWCDVDDDSEAAYKRLEGLALPPTMILHSGGGYHGYWQLNEPLQLSGDDFKLVEQVNHGIAIAAKGDEICRNVNRILRTPGFVNIKPERGGAIAKVMYHDTDRYMFKALVRTFAHLAAPPQPQVKRHVPKEAYSSELPKRVLDFLQHGTVKAVGRNAELFYCARAYNDAGLSQSEAERDLIPVVTSIAGEHKVTENEAMKTVASAFKRAASPRLPKHMQQRMAIADRRGDR